MTKTKPYLKIENLTFLGALLGLLIGLTIPQLASSISFLGDIFLVLLKMTIVPLIFVSVFLAVAKQAGSGQLSKLGLRTLGYFLLTSTLACATGLFAATLLPKASTSVPGYSSFDSSNLNSFSFTDVIMSFFPSNPFAAMAEGDILQIVVFALILGVAASFIAEKQRHNLAQLSDAAHDLILAVIKGILYLAPVGILALVASVVASTRLNNFQGLAWFFVAVGLAASIHMLLTLPLVGYLIGRFHPYKFMIKTKEAILMALATASSSATLPVSTRVLETKAGVSKQSTGFVLPLGATLNMDGSALYQALVVIFLGGMAGVDFTFSQQLLVFMFVMLSSAGTAGIPGGGLVMMGAMLDMVGVPLEMIGIYLLVDRFWDPIITAVNVTGDLFGTKTIDRFVKKEDSTRTILVNSPSDDMLDEAFDEESKNQLSFHEV